MTPTVAACGIYARISQDDGTALGVARQVADCTAEAERRGWPIGQQFVDNDVSATRGKPRPEYVRLLEEIQTRRIDAVIVWDIDRLTRTPSELETFIDLADKNGVALASIGGETDLATPQGRLTARIKGNVARHEVEQTSRRLKRKYQDLASEGKPHGVAPFGYRRERITDDKGRIVGSNDVVVPGEADAMRELYRRVIAGESLRSLAAYLNGLGFVTGQGNAWRGAGVRQMLLKPRYVGLRTHHGEVVGQGQWEPLIDQDTYDRTHAILTAPGRRHSRGLAPKYLGSGIYLCGRCGGDSPPALRPIINANFNGVGRPPTYACPVCMRLARQMAPVDEVVEAVVIGRLEDPALLEHMSEDPGEMNRAVQERDAVLARMDELADSLTNGDMTRRQFARVNAGHMEQLERAESKLQGLYRPGGLEDVAGPDAANAWAGLTIERKREIVRTLLRVTILPAGRGIRFAPEHVRIEWNTDLS
jgi:site-specific DNA recombinase